MNPNTYQNEARRTAPRARDAYPFALRLAAAEVEMTGMSAEDLLRGHDILIWALGLAGEAGELEDAARSGDRSKVSKEAGDVLWYVSNLADVHGLKLDDVARTMHRATSSVTIEAAKVCDLLKKVHGHGKAFNLDALRAGLAGVIFEIALVCDRFELKIGEVCAENVDKLRARYPDGFTVAAAEARADERARLPDCPRDANGSLVERP